MGCASSSNPLEAAKKAAGDMMDAGEKAMSDVGESVENTMESAVESVQNVTNSIGDAIKSGKDKIKEKLDDMDDDVKTIDEDMENEDERIPLHTSEEMENMKNKMMNKMGSLGSEADDMADELMNETEMAMRDMDDEVMTIVQETSDLAHVGEDVMDAMKNEIMNNPEDDMLVEDIEGSNDSTQEMTDTATPEEASEIKADTNDKRITAPRTTAAWGGSSFKHLSSVVASTVKQQDDSEYKPTAWELLADSILQTKMKSKFSKDDEDTKKKDEEEEKSLTLKEKMEIAEMNERERALCYYDRRN